MEEKKQPKEESSGIRAMFEGKNFLLFALATLLIPIMYDTSFLLTTISPIKSQWYGLSFAIPFEIAIFIFALRGRRQAAVGLAFITFLDNYCFFNLDTLTKQYHPQLVVAIVSFVICATASYILHTYVNLYSDNKEEESDMAMWENTAHQRQDQINKLNGELNALRKELKEKETLALKQEVELATIKEQTALRSDVEKERPEPSSTVVQIIRHAKEQPNELADLKCSVCNKTTTNEGGFRTMKKYCSNSSCDKTLVNNKPKEPVMILAES